MSIILNVMYDRFSRHGHKITRCYPFIPLSFLTLYLFHHVKPLHFCRKNPAHSIKKPYFLSTYTHFKPESSRQSIVANILASSYFSINESFFGYRCNTRESTFQCNRQQMTKFLRVIGHNK